MCRGWSIHASFSIVSKQVLYRRCVSALSSLHAHHGSPRETAWPGAHAELAAVGLHAVALGGVRAADQLRLDLGTAVAADPHRAPRARRVAGVRPVRAVAQAPAAVARALGAAGRGGGAGHPALQRDRLLALDAGGSAGLLPRSGSHG